MKHCRLICLILACVLCLVPLASCAKSDDPGKNDVTGSVSLNEEDTSDPHATLDLPDDLDFKDYTFRVLTVDSTSLYTMFDVDGITGDPINDAIYERDRILENRFHVRFETASDGYDATLSMMSKQVRGGLTGSDAYDLIMEICRNAYALTLNGMLCDYSRLEYVDTDKEYYFENVNRQFSIGGRTFFAYGADALNVLAQSNCLIFNKAIAEKHSMPDLYKLVKDGDWTYAEMARLCTEAAFDSDGDGKYIPNRGDVLAMVGRGDYVIPNAWIASGETLIAKDEDDMPYYAAVGNERMASAMTEMLNFLNTSVCNVSGPVDLDLDFVKGNAFMLGGGILYLKDCKEMEDDYGVLPYPKYDKVQGQYSSRVIDGWINCVPANCPDPERTSAIMQALAYYSYGSVYDAYYKTGLEAKFIRDPESVEMMRLIMATLSVDLGDTVWYSAMRSVMTGPLGSPNGAGQVTSLLKRMENVAKAQIKSVTKFIDKNPG